MCPNFNISLIIKSTVVIQTDRVNHLYEWIIVENLFEFPAIGMNTIFNDVTKEKLSFTDREN